MNNLLVTHLHSIRNAALQAVDPSNAIRQHLQMDSENSGGLLKVGNIVWRLSELNHLYLIAVGKAATPMAQAVCEILGSRLDAGIVVTPYGHSHGCSLPETVRIFEAGHPIPDASGMIAVQAVEELLKSTRSTDRLVILLSGGASALLVSPPAGITLEEMQSCTSLLLRSGATIQELNTVRKHIDRLKGGQLVRLTQSTPLVALILSDVVGDSMEIIASGPTVPDPSTFSKSWSIIEKYNLQERIPASIANYLKNGLEGRCPETPKPGDPIFGNVLNEIIGSNRLAAEAAIAEATRLGYHALLLTTFVEGEAREVGKLAGAIAKGLHFQGTPVSLPACVVWGGETTVTVRGPGKGGRNQELALAAALALEGVPDVALMALATDGIDGPTDAAGAVIDGGTIAAARRLGLDPNTYLARNDAYPFLKTVGALMVSGPTNTNVNDLLVILAK